MVCPPPSAPKTKGGSRTGARPTKTILGHLAPSGESILFVVITAEDTCNNLIIRCGPMFTVKLFVARGLFSGGGLRLAVSCVGSILSNYGALSLTPTPVGSFN
jgi:hypothetical protein